MNYLPANSNETLSRFFFFFFLSSSSFLPFPLIIPKCTIPSYFKVANKSVRRKNSIPSNSKRIKSVSQSYALTEGEKVKKEMAERREERLNVEIPGWFEKRFQPLLEWEPLKIVTALYKREWNTFITRLL